MRELPPRPRHEWRSAQDAYLHNALRAWEETLASDWAGGSRERLARLIRVMEVMILFLNEPIERAIERWWRSLAGRISGGERRAHMQLPPGHRLRALAQFLFSRRTYSVVLEPTLTDLQEEYFQALAEHRSWTARMVRLRGYWSFWAAVLAQLPVAAIRVIVKLWKLG